MSTRTARDHRYGYIYERYVCTKRLHHGPLACPQRPIKRELIDEAVYRYFETVALDEDATCRAFKNHASQEMSDVEAHQRQAECEVAKADAALARIECDYVAGKLSAENWQRLQDRLAGERKAAHEQAKQHERRRKQVEDAISALDVERAIAEELTALRQTITGQLRDGEHGGLDSFRATLRRLFTGFELASPSGPFGSGALRGQAWAQSDGDDQDVLGLGDYWLIPFIAPHAIDLDASDQAGFPAVERVAFALHNNLCSRLAAW